MHSSHSWLSGCLRSGRGITDGLIRFTVGLEETDDLPEDLLAALDVAMQAAAG